MDIYRQKELFREALYRIASKGSILLVSPVQPDADSCASMFAMRRFIRENTALPIDPNIILWAPEKPSPNTMFQRLKPLGDPATEITTELPPYALDLVVAFDYGQFRRLRLDSLVGKTFFIGFDHHPQDENGSGFPNDGVNGIEVSDPRASSTTALLYKFFLEVDPEYLLPDHSGIGKPDVAECLLVGLMADTGKLTNKLTSIEALEIAADLVRKGADYHGVIESMQMQISLTAFSAQLKARDQITIDPRTGLGFITFSQEDLQKWGVTVKDLLPLHGLIQSIEGVLVAAAYFERPDRTWYCSLRNRSGKGVKVNEIAIRLAKGGEGGGHDYAAGFVSDETPQEIFRKLKLFLVE